MPNIQSFLTYFAFHGHQVFGSTLNFSLFIQYLVNLDLLDFSLVKNSINLNLFDFSTKYFFIKSYIHHGQPNLMMITLIISLFNIFFIAQL